VVSFFAIFTAMSIPLNVATLTKREHTQRIRLIGLMTLVCAFALIILPTLKAQISSIESGYRLLGLFDTFKERNDYCPNDPTKTSPGICGCGTPDSDTDTDGDGLLDCQETCPNDAGKTSPGVCGCDTPDIDKDEDGTLDCQDACPFDAGKTSSGVCGCGTADTDKDNDGTPDCRDGCPNDANKKSAGVCGCGTPDTDKDKDGTPDCRDGCPNDAGKTSPGSCGCGTPDTDANGDKIPDCFDDCLENDPSIIYICEEYFPGFECGGCAEQFITSRWECSEQCSSEISYCIKKKLSVYSVISLCLT